MLEVSPRVLAHSRGFDIGISMYARLVALNTTTTEVLLRDLVTTDEVRLRINDYAVIDNLNDSQFVYIEGQWRQGEVEVFRIRPVDQFGALMDKQTVQRLVERIDMGMAIASQLESQLESQSESA